MSGIESPSVPFLFSYQDDRRVGVRSRLRTPESGGFVGESASRLGFARLRVFYLSSVIQN